MAQGQSSQQRLWLTVAGSLMLAACSAKTGNPNLRGRDGGGAQNDASVEQIDGSTTSSDATTASSDATTTTGDATPMATIDSGARDATLVPDSTAYVAPDVEVEITADNAYSFGYGSLSEIETFYAGTRAVTSAQIFACPIGEGPEAYTVPGADAPDGSYLYIVSWDDLNVSQGVIAQFRRVGGGDPTYSGDAAFEVCATGVNFSSSSSPTLTQINEEIAKCNAGTGDESTTSSGWVNSAGAVTPGAIGKLAIGEPNEPNAGPDDFGDMPQVCTMDSTGHRGIDEAARWMWYTPSDSVTEPFKSTGENTFRAFLIFRLAAQAVVVY